MCYLSERRDAHQWLLCMLPAAPAYGVDNGSVCRDHRISDRMQTCCQAGGQVEWENRRHPVSGSKTDAQCAGAVYQPGDDPVVGCGYDPCFNLPQQYLGHIGEAGFEALT